MPPLDAWPEGIALLAFDPGRHAAEVHVLLAEAYLDGGGGGAPFAAWWPGVRDDADFDPSLVFLAAEPEGHMVGVALCWTTAYVKDLAVAAPWRRRGVGRALLTHAFNHFRERGVSHVDLKVETGNSSGAIELYRRLGMEPVPR